ncbi:hypothetical protein [Bradyrhizobium shewense]|uniref:hypothetical protein n=1 Tax=Bradyrhizobium shewense TaxID=1761772 RepID=UPI00101ADF1C|nr:hypothetical protein [Bradyrhizobium shewense]
MTDIAQLQLQSNDVLSRKEKRRIVTAWRIGVVAFYGSLLALVIAFAATTERPQVDQAYLLSDDFISHYVSPRP